MKAPSRPLPYFLRPLALILLCAALFLPGLSTIAVSRQQELRVILTARTMANGGSWLIPRFMGEERLRKPPLMNWLVASAFELAHSSASPGVARLPSALCGTLLVLAVHAFGRRLLGGRAGMLAAVLLATSFLLIRHARLAETDVALTLFVFLSIACGSRALHAARPTWSWLGMGLFAGLGFMVKGPAALVLPPLTVIGFALWEPSTRQAVRSWRPAWALLPFVAVAAPWYIYIIRLGQLRAQAGSQVNRELQALLTDSHHTGPFYYYLYTLPKALGLWGLLLPVALFMLVRVMRNRRPLRFILWWFATTFLVLSALSSKQQHYVLLLFPPSALAMGWFLRYAWDEGQSWKGYFTRIYLRAGLVITGLAGMGLIALYFRNTPFPTSPAWCWMGSTLIICSATALVLQGRPGIWLACTASAIAALTGIYALDMSSYVESQAQLPVLVARAQNAIRLAPRIYCVGAHSAMFEYYAMREVEVRDSVQSAWDAAGPGDVILIARNRHKDDTRDDFPVEPREQLRWKDLDATVLVKPRPAI